LGEKGNNGYKAQLLIFGYYFVSVI